MYTDAIMLGWLRTAEDLGLYAAAQRPVQLLAIVPTVIAASLLPVMSRLLHKDKAKFRSITDQAMALTMALALPIAVGGWLMGDQLIDLLYGTSYAQAEQIFSILVIYLLSAFPAAIIFNAILASDRQQQMLPPVIMGAVANLILNWWLIPRWGGLGAAMATAVSQIFAQVVLYYQMQAIFHFRLITNILKVMLATVLMGLVIWGLQKLGAGFWLSLLGAVVTYVGFLMVTKETLWEKLKAILSEQDAGSPASH